MTAAATTTAAAPPQAALLDDDDQKKNDSEDHHTNINSIDVCLSTGDILAKIQSFLSARNVVCECRLVSRAWRDAPTPVTSLEIATPTTAAQQKLPLVAQCLPHLQSLTILHSANLSSDSDDDDYSPLSALASFGHLKSLKILEQASLVRGFAHILELSHLRSLNLHNNTRLVWDLHDLAASLPHLCDLRCVNNKGLTGDLADLQPLSRQITVLDVSGCTDVTGNLLDVATWPVVQWLGLSRTAIVGDVRDIQKAHFPDLQWAGLNDKMYGASEIQHIAHAPAVMQARHQLVKNSARQQDTQTLFPLLVRLSETSPDWHQRPEQDLYTSELDPPMHLEPVVVSGPRRGWRWSNGLGGCCEVHWLDPVPDDETTSYVSDLAELDEETQTSMFAGFWNPPTRHEYAELLRRFRRGSA